MQPDETGSRAPLHSGLSLLWQTQGVLKVAPQDLASCALGIPHPGQPWSQGHLLVQLVTLRNQVSNIQWAVGSSLGSRKHKAPGKNNQTLSQETSAAPSLLRAQGPGLCRNSCLGPEDVPPQALALQTPGAEKPLPRNISVSSSNGAKEAQADRCAWVHAHGQSCRWPLSGSSPVHL